MAQLDSTKIELLVWPKLVESCQKRTKLLCGANVGLQSHKSAQIFHKGVLCNSLR
jgi:hypothetical protein